MTSEKDTMADELAEKVWQALARHGTLLDDIERRSVAEALSTTPANDARTPDDVVEALDELDGSDFEAVRRHSATLRAALTASGDAREHHAIPNGAPPEPVSHPSEEWCEQYAAWYEGRAALLDTPTPAQEGKAE